MSGPHTSPSLLMRLRDPADADAWGRFAGLYGPLLRAFGRRWGLQDADALDLTQDVLRAVHAAVPRLTPGGGSFRGWLYTVARNRCRDLHRARRPSAPLLSDPPAPEEADEWELDFRRRAFAQAADEVRGQVKEATWRAFWLTAVEGRTGEEAGAELGLSVGAVHVARSRVLARLRDAVRPLVEG